VDDIEFRVGNIVRLNSAYCLQHGYDDNPSVRFVVEEIDPDSISVRCISTGDKNNSGFIAHLGYFGPPRFFNRDSVKDKFKRRKPLWQEESAK